MNPSSGQAPVAGRALVTATFYVCMRATWIVEWIFCKPTFGLQQCALRSRVRHRARFETLGDRPLTRFEPYVRDASRKDKM